MSISLACPTIGLRIARTPTMTLFIHRITKRKKGLPLRPGGKGGRADDLESFIVRCGHRTLCFSFLFKGTLLVLAEWWRLCKNYELRMSRFWKRDSLTSFSGSENINLRINSPSSPQYNICNHWTSQPMVAWWSMLMVYSSSNPLLEGWHGDVTSKHCPSTNHGLNP